MRVVFIGDSITEAGKFTDSERLGTGYVRLIHDYLITTYPTSHFEILNNGISGNRIDDLKARWQTDVLDVKPDIICISIGINQEQQQLTQPSMHQQLPDDFKQRYDDLLQQSKRTTNAKIIEMEQTIIDEDLAAPGDHKLRAYEHNIHGIDPKYDVLVVPKH